MKNSWILKPLLIFSGVSLAMSSLWGAGDMTIPRFENELTQAQVPLDCSPELGQNFNDCLLPLQSYLSKCLAAAEENLQQGLGNSGDWETAIELYQYAQTQVDKIQSGKLGMSPQKMRSAYVQSLRMIYSAKSIAHVGQSAGRPGKVVRQVISRGFSEVNFTPRYKLDQRLGSDLAAKESSFLVRGGSSQEYVSVDQMAAMTTLEVSLLDVSETHPAWYSRQRMKEKSDPYGDLETWVNQVATKGLTKAGALAKGEKYDLRQARHVLLLQGLKDTATSPKVKTRDIYGMKWKLKWGNEVQTEPITNRLYAQLGGKYVDLLYSNPPGGDGLVLILGEPKGEDNCDSVVSVKTLQKCLASPPYQFDLKPYIAESGFLSQENEDQVLVQLEPQKRSQFRGYQYVTFYESAVEFGGSKVLKRGGPVAGSLLGATNDRVARGLFLFNLWIKNIDAKDENNKSLILKNFGGQKRVYVETQHDLGAALGDISGIDTRPGMVNGFETSFIERVEPSAEGWYSEQNILHFPIQLLYKPKAWERDIVTHADMLWMARQIAGLSLDQIEQAVASSQWPDFMVKSMTYRLAQRRNQVGEVYNVRVADAGRVSAPNGVVDLRTIQRRQEAAQKYGIDLIAMESELRRHGRLDDQGRSSYIDRTLSQGKVASCERSLVVNLLEKGRYPSGLSRRVLRSADDKPLPFCRWSPRHR